MNVVVSNSSDKMMQNVEYKPTAAGVDSRNFEMEKKKNLES